MHTLLADILFPKRCLGCAKERSYCCEDCLSLLPLAPAPSLLPPSSSLAGLFCATSWENKFVQRLIHSFKYAPFLRDLATPLAYLIVSHFALSNNATYPAPFHRALYSPERCGIYPPDIVVPVPLHKKRLKWRGYNHAQELANRLGYAFSVPVAANTLVKTKNTSPQAILKRERRLQNVRDVFEVVHGKEIQNKTILLVDDVFTTGATMEECARTLLRAGAAKVYATAVARD